MKRFENKTILITGGSSGIGLAGAKRLSDEGARVIITGKTPKHLDNARAVLGEKAIIISHDAEDEKSTQDFYDEIARIGHLDGLWLNAAYAAGANIESMDRTTITKMFDVNVVTHMLQMGRFSPILKDGGSVVVTSSTAVYEGLAGVSLYSATKAAILSAARSWASELAPRKIRVNSLVPGPIKSNLRSGLPLEMKNELENHLAETLLLKRIGEPEEAAAVAAFLLSDDASFVTGSSYLVDGGYLLM